MRKSLLIILIMPLIIFSEYIGFDFGLSNKPVKTKDFLFVKEKACSECHTVIYNKKNMHAAAEDCATCHESITKKHPKKNEIGFKLVDKVPSLCFACHEDNATKKNVHYPSGDGDCLSCHDPHGSKKPGLLKKSNAGKLCAECHDMDPMRKEFRHRPVQKGNCQSCHDAHQSDNKALLKQTAPALCFTCHEDKKKAMEMKNIHMPFDDDCSTCHVVHSSDYKNLTTDAMPNLCYQCHDDVKTKLDKAKYVHKAVNEKSACAGCHDPHASNNDKFLYAEGQDLCLRCHNKDIKGELGTIRNIKKLVQKKYVHPPLEFDGCAACHQAHSADYEMLLVDAFPAGRYAKAAPESFSLCYNCHDSEALTAKETTSATQFRNGNINMHAMHIKGDKGRSCSNCHNVHGAENEHLIEDAVPFGRWEMPIRYKITDNGGSCAPACHGLLEYDRTAKPVVKDIGEIISTDDINNDTADLIKKTENNNNEDIAEISNTDELKEANAGAIVVPAVTNNEKKTETVNTKVINTEIVKTLEENNQSITQEEQNDQEQSPEENKIEEQATKTEEITEETIVEEDNKDPNLNKGNGAAVVTGVTASVVASTVTKNEEKEVKETSEKTVEKTEEATVVTETITETAKEVTATETNINATAVVPAVIKTEENQEETAKEIIAEATTEEVEKTAVRESTNTTTILEEFNNLTKPELRFEFDKAFLIEGTDKGIDEVVNFMKKYPNITFEIQGYTDSIGSASYNIYLSEKRAISVQKLLINKGINKSRIPVKGYGEANPISSNKTIKSRAKNRRVEIKPINLK